MQNIVNTIHQGRPPIRIVFMVVVAGCTAGARFSRKMVRQCIVNLHDEHEAEQPKRDDATQLHENKDTKLTVRSDQLP